MNANVSSYDWFDRPVPANVDLAEGAWLYSAFSLLHFTSAHPRAVAVGPHSGVYDRTHFELGPSGRVTIGAWCSIVGAIINTNRHIVIGDYTFIAHEVVIADDAFAVPPEADAHAKPPAARAEGIRIGTNVWIGARAIVLGSASIGDNAVVGAGTTVTDDVTAYAIAVGNPARVVGWVRQRCEP